MRAAIYERTGPASEVLQIVEMADPVPGPGEVRVKLEWSGVNPSDVKSRAGVRTKILPFPRIVPHSDGSGIIDDVGAGVSRTRIGERVWTWNAACQRPCGTAAGFVVLPQEQAVQLPETVQLASGACLGIPALTAFHAVNVNGGVAGKNVLVAGGAGAVGHYAIQIARRMGATQILTTVSGPKKAALAQAAGADVVINYKSENVATRVQQATEGRGVDRIIEVDFGTNIGLDLQLVRPDGEVIVYGSNAMEIAVPFVPMIMKNIGLRFFIVYNLSADDRRVALAGLSEMLQSGSLLHNIAAILPLDEIAAAHDLVESGRSAGNVVLATC